MAGGKTAPGRQKTDAEKVLGLENMARRECPFGWGTSQVSVARNAGKPEAPQSNWATYPA